MTFYVYGGERPDPSVNTFRDPAAIEFTGAFDRREDARDAWKARAWMTVDNALMRFEIHTYDEIVAIHGKAIADRAVAASGATYS
jgi:hypothetical protein